MGESLDLFRAEFNRSIRVETRDERLTSNAGAVMLRDALQRLGMTDWLERRLVDRRKKALITHPQIELVTTMVFLYALGWQDQDDADAMRDDPAFRLAASKRRGTGPLDQREPDERQRDRNPAHPDGLASQPTMSRVMRALASDANRPVLRESLVEIASRRFRSGRRGHRKRYLTLDVDSLPVEVHGQQVGSAYNGYYHARIFHPLVASVAETGDMLDIRLREGNVHTANGALEFIDKLIDRVEAKMCQVAAVRMDAGFPEETLLAALETRDTPYVARIKNNPVLKKMAEPHLKRPPGRPPKEPRTWLYEMRYQAGTWSKARRVVLVVLERPGELFLHHFWLITNWAADQIPGDELLDRYRQRGSAEARFGEFMSTLRPALSSATRPKSHYRGKKIESERRPDEESFAINEVILMLNALAYNLLHVVRSLMETGTGDGWSVQRTRERVLRGAIGETSPLRQVRPRPPARGARLRRQHSSHCPTHTHPRQPCARGPRGGLRAHRCRGAEGTDGGVRPNWSR